MTSVLPHSPFIQGTSGSRLRRAAAKRTKKPSFSLRPIKVLPDVSEEDESQFTSSSSYTNDAPFASKNLGGIQEAGKRYSKPRPVGFMVEGHSLESMLLANGPRPLKEQSRLSGDVSSVIVDGFSFDFPRPPMMASPSAIARSLSNSPTLSASGSTSSSTPDLPATPTTSDDEFSFPSVAPLSIMKGSVPRDSVARVFAPLDNVGCQELDLSLSGMLEEVKAGNEEDESQWFDMDDNDDAIEFYRSNIGTHLETIHSTFVTSPRLTPRGSYSSLFSAPARRDSFPLPPHLTRRRSSASSIGSNTSTSSSRSRRSKSLNKRKSRPLPPTPTSAGSFGPSAELDPTFPRRLRRSYTIPSRPPPPPPSSFTLPIIRTPDMPSTPSKLSSFPTRPRPPPRSSLPVDIDFCDPFGEEEEQFAFFVDEPISPLSESRSSAPVTPESPEMRLSYATSPLDVPVSPTAGSDDFHSHVEGGTEPDHALRSRWSTSTLGSVVEASPRSKFSWFSSKTFKSESKTKPKTKMSTRPIPIPFHSSSPSARSSPSSPFHSPSKSNHSLPTPSSSPTKSDLGPTTPSNVRVSSFFNSMRGPISPSPSPQHHHAYSSTPNQHTTQRSTDSISSFSFSSRGSGLDSGMQSPTRGVRRSQSRSSTFSEQSGSSASSRDSMGLRRKPIPVEIFMRN